MQAPRCAKESVALRRKLIGVLALYVSHDKLVPQGNVPAVRASPHKILVVAGRAGGGLWKNIFMRA